MKMRNITVPVVVAILTVAWLATPTKIHADFVTGQTQNVVDTFNSLNDGRGYYYTVSTSLGRWVMTNVEGYEQADFSAYGPSTSGENFAYSFCVEPIIGTGARHVSQLNYDGNSTKTSEGNALTVGAAYLYANFASGMLDGYDYESPSYYGDSDLIGSLHSVMGLDDRLSWSTSEYLTAMLDVNPDQSYWEQTYDPGRFYDEIGDYSVFVMNNTDEYGTNTQDFLYLAGYEGGSPETGSATPEPASMLIVGTGIAGLGLIGRRRKKK